MNTATAEFVTITSRLGIYAGSTHHLTQRAAEMSARKAINSGQVDSAAVWTATKAVAFFGSGR